MVYKYTVFILVCTCLIAKGEGPLSGAETVDFWVIGNRHIQLRLPNPVAPDRYYQGQRFTLPGMVVSAQWRGTELFTERGLPDRDPRHHDHAGGTAEEFDINGPADYADTPVGGDFMKIGVGLLRREDDRDYRFSRPYPVSVPAVNTVQPIDDQTIQFTQTLQHKQRGYRLLITVATTDHGFVVRRQLVNTGQEPIQTEHYSHNFIRIGSAEINADYQVAWQTPVAIRDISTGGGQMHYSATGITLVGVPAEAFYFASEKGSGLPAFEPMTLVNHRLGISMSIINDQPLYRVAVWGDAGAISPEPFVRIRVAPGESFSWATEYRVAAHAQAMENRVAPN